MFLNLGVVVASFPSAPIFASMTSIVVETKLLPIFALQHAVFYSLNTVFSHMPIMTYKILKLYLSGRFNITFCFSLFVLHYNLNHGRVHIKFLMFFTSLRQSMNWGFFAVLVYLYFCFNADSRMNNPSETSKPSMESGDGNTGKKL